MASVLDLSRLANAVYLTDGGVIAGQVSGWVATSKQGDPNNGFYAVLFKRSRDQEAVLAIRGTDPTQMDDLKSDAQLAQGGVPGQFYSADGFITHLRSQLGGRSLYVTGHSLGGGLASLLATKYRLPTVTFNAPGMKNSMCSLLGQATPTSTATSTAASTATTSIAAQQQAARQRAEREINSLDISKMLNIRASGDVVSRGTGPAIGRVEDIVVPEGGTTGWQAAAAATMPVLGSMFIAGKYALGQHSMDNVCRAIALLPKYQADLNWVAVPPPPVTAGPKVTSKVHTVVSGDTLAKIAQTYYKDAARWKDIYAVPVNRTAIGTNPAMIRPGLRLEIPV